MSGVANQSGALGLAADEVVRPDGTVGPATVWVARSTGRITGIEPGRPDPRARRAAGADVAERADVAEGADVVERADVVDLGARLIAPGFVDVHVHGGDGAEVNGSSADDVARSVTRVAAFHASHGTTAMLATTVTDTPERLAASVAGIARAARTTAPSGARILGSHLEGPFLAPGRAGAQNPAHLRAPDRDELRRLLELGEGTVRLVTLAPELPGADALIADCLEAGAVVALGHTNADEEAARRAFAAGASHVTHLWNAMAPLHHRRPGLVGAALADPTVTVEVICDLHHVSPSVVALTARLAPGRVVLVTDAISATGAGPGRYTLGALPVVVEDGRASLAEDPDTLAGSVLTMDAAVRNAAGAVGIKRPAALRAATSTPASVLHDTQGSRGALTVGTLAIGALTVGTLAVGALADIVVLEPTLAVAATLVGGRPVHDPGRLFA